MSSISLRRSSTSKQTGAAMSSRLMPPQAGRDRGDRLDEDLGVLRVDADRVGVDAAELLEEHRLALHDRHARGRADVAEAEHRGAVGDDRDHVALDRELEGLRAVLGDRLADPRHARHVGHREVVAGLERARGWSSRSCRPGASGRCGRRTRRRVTPSRPPAAATIASACSWSDGVRRRARGPASRSRLPTRSIAPMSPPTSPIAVVSWPSRSVWRGSISTRRVTLYWALGVTANGTP